MTNQFGLKSIFRETSLAARIPQNTPVGHFLRTRLCTDVSQAVGADTMLPHVPAMRALAKHLVEPDLLEGIPCAGSSEHYTRELLHAGPGYSILAIVWLPGQASPIHAHLSWCALGVYQGELVETYLTAKPSVATGRNELQMTGCRQLGAGTVSGSEADANRYHRVANMGVMPAISIHVYGVPFDRLGTDLNKVWPG